MNSNVMIEQNDLERYLNDLYERKDLLKNEITSFYYTHSNSKNLGFMSENQNRFLALTVDLPNNNSLINLSVGHNMMLASVGIVKSWQEVQKLHNAHWDYWWKMNILPNINTSKTL